MSASPVDDRATDHTLTETANRRDWPKRTSTAPHLFVLLECERLAAASSRHSLANIDRVVVGRARMRSPARIFVDGIRTLAIGVPDQRMSSEHFEIVRDGETYSLCDLRSRNGMFLNGGRVTGRVPLTEGDLLVAGRTIFLYRAAVVAPIDAPADRDGSSLDSGSAFETLEPSLEVSLRELRDMACSAVPVLICGETGTGKEIAARAIHRLSKRPGEFIPVNCAALPSTLFEAELFGRVRSALSGPSSDALGLVRGSDRGTLFLDEVGDLPPAGQAALLRVLQDREVLPVGGDRALSVDLRVVAATHRDLEDLGARGQFRSDLLARLSGFTIRLPPLRARREDIGILLAALAGGRPLRCSVEAGRALASYDWPRNVRELRHALDSALTLAGGETIDLDHLPAAVRAAARAPALSIDPLQERIVEALLRHRGNISQVARELDVARMQVHRWLKRFGIDGESFRR